MDSSSSREVMSDSSVKNKRGAEDGAVGKRSSAKVRFDETAGDHPKTL